MEEKKERNWNIKDWEEFRKALATMQPRSKLFKTIKKELDKRGHWKNAPRGSYKRDSK